MTSLAGGDSKTKEEQYKALRDKQAEKFQEKENIRKGIQPGGNTNFDNGNMDALENMDLDRKVDDS